MYKKFLPEIIQEYGITPNIYNEFLIEQIKNQNLAKKISDNWSEHEYYNIRPAMNQKVLALFKIMIEFLVNNKKLVNEADFQRILQGYIRGLAMPFFSILTPYYREK